MKNYEAMVILEATAPDADTEILVKSFETDLVTGGGTIVSREIQGKRVLSYQIKGHREGIYTLLNFQAPSEAITKLEKKFRTTPQVLRFLLLEN